MKHVTSHKDRQTLSKLEGKGAKAAVVDLLGKRHGRRRGMLKSLKGMPTCHWFSVALPGAAAAWKLASCSARSCLVASSASLWPWAIAAAISSTSSSFGS